MSATVRYELAVWIEVLVEDEDDPRDYVTPAEKSRLEREVLQHLRRVNGTLIDCEVMDTTITADPADPRERGDDDGVEYGDPRDAREGGRR
jgi:hypothetical protein